MQEEKAIPVVDRESGPAILSVLARDRSLLTAMKAMNVSLGNIFRITMPRFQPVVVAGSEFCRQVLITDREKFRWRGTSDPVVKLLRHGILVEDGPEHDRLRAIMEPSLRRTPTLEHIPAMIDYIDRVTANWPAEGEVDMLVEMRKVALLVLIGTVYGTDFSPQLADLWEPILKAIQYISPGPWIVWPGMPRFGYGKNLQAVDDFLYGLIRRRREEGGPADDLLGSLMAAPDLDDDQIRDQLLTMLIAGHDTSTAMMAWMLLMLGEHPEMLAQVEEEVRDEAFGWTEQGLSHTTQLDNVIKETLRLYPPIHVGNRFAREDMELQGYEIPEETRVMVSIYLTHRDDTAWDEAEQFCPQRFDRSRQTEPTERRPPLSYIPFGAGPRNCIGATFAQVEGKVILARILQEFELELSPGQKIRPHMGATLEPRPGVMMIVKRRSTN